MKIEKRICRYCGKEFDPQRLGRRRLYCSPECTNLANNKRKRMRGNIAREQKKEAECKQRYYQRYVKSHERMNAIAKMQQETGVSYGKLEPVWDDKIKLAQCIARYRTK